MCTCVRSEHRPLTGNASGSGSGSLRPVVRRLGSGPIRIWSQDHPWTRPSRVLLRVHKPCPAGNDDATLFRVATTRQRGHANEPGRRSGGRAATRYDAYVCAVRRGAVCRGAGCSVQGEQDADSPRTGTDLIVTSPGQCAGTFWTVCSSHCPGPAAWGGRNLPTMWLFFQGRVWTE